MGNDAPLACLSNFAPLPYDYFKQLFAQVTNPPIDPFREKVVMSLQCPIGPEANILQPSPKQVHRIWLKQPVLSIADLEVLKLTKHRSWSSFVIDATFPVTDGPCELAPTLQRLCEQAQLASKHHQIIVLSDRKASDSRVPISSLLALGNFLYYSNFQILSRIILLMVIITMQLVVSIYF